MPSSRSEEKSNVWRISDKEAGAASSSPVCLSRVR